MKHKQLNITCDLSLFGINHLMSGNMAACGSTKPCQRLHKFPHRVDCPDCIKVMEELAHKQQFPEPHTSI